MPAMPASPVTAGRSIGLTLCLGAVLLALPTWAAGPWTSARVLQGRYGVSSPPESPLVAMNASGETLFAWNATGVVRTAGRRVDGSWTAGAAVPGGGTAAGPLALAIGRGGLAAIAYTTVATRYVPSRVRVSLRPAGGDFLPAVEIDPGAPADTVRVGIDCAGTVTLVWRTGIGLASSSLPGAPVPAGTCNGTPGAGAWSHAVPLSNTHVGASQPELAVNDAGDAVVVWQEGAPGHAASILAAQRPAGGAWQAPQPVSAPTALATGSAVAGLAADGRAWVGYLDGHSLWLAERPQGGAWAAPVPLSDAHTLQSAALAGDGSGGLVAAWLATDASGNPAVWTRQRAAAGPWLDPVRLSARADLPERPSVAMSGGDGLAVVAWTDNAAQVVRAAVWKDGAWTRQGLGPAYWGGSVGAAAGGGRLGLGWARTVDGNPNLVQLVGRGTP